MIAVDTNVLVYAHRRDADFHHSARRTLIELCEGKTAWGLPTACIAEFMAVVTNRRIFESASSVEQAVAQVEAWLAAPSAHLLTCGAQHWKILSELSLQAKLQGGQFHDARIAAICIENGVQLLYTADRDFGRFKALKTANPLI